MSWRAFSSGRAGFVTCTVFGSSGRTTSPANRSILNLQPGRPDTAEAIFALAESSAALAEQLPQFLVLLKLWFRDLLLLHHRQPGRVVNLDLGEALTRGQTRWTLPQLPARFKLFEAAELQLARNCNRGLVCEVLYFGLL